MKKWNLIIDVAKCENCNNCALAVKDEYIGNEFPGYAAPMPRHGHDWISIVRTVRGSGSMVDAAYRPTTCNHCDNAPCITAGRGAVRKRDDGIVIIDPTAARGRRDLVESCPYGMIWWNEELELPQHWIFDAHLLDQGWKQTRGGHACPTGAMRAVQADDAEMAEMARERGLEVLRPELGTRPRVYYQNLYRFDKCFVGGSVIGQVNGSTECISGAQVRLNKDSRLIAEASTDTFGDFKFDRLDPNSGRYRVEVSHPAHGAATIDVDVTESVYAGSIVLEKSGARQAGN